VLIEVEHADLQTDKTTPLCINFNAVVEKMHTVTNMIQLCFKVMCVCLFVCLFVYLFIYLDWCCEMCTAKHIYCETRLKSAIL